MPAPWSELARGRLLWRHESSRCIAIPLPLTRFTLELMHGRRVRDPDIAVRAEQLSSSLTSSGDAELTEAFFHYNALRPKIADAAAVQPPHAGPRRIDRLLRGLRGQTHS